MFTSARHSPGRIAMYESHEGHRATTAGSCHAGHPTEKSFSPKIGGCRGRGAAAAGGPSHGLALVVARGPRNHPHPKSGGAGGRGCCHGGGLRAEHLHPDALWRVSRPRRVISPHDNTPPLPTANGRRPLRGPFRPLGTVPCTIRTNGGDHMTMFGQANEGPAGTGAPRTSEIHDWA